uniref:Uncharacterized protein n=1 Tax=Palpitomonas bilix TaxID=652834 RepID=A0A7S3G6K5_9EUKA|mmetsp:Transcript_30029/g.77470  ORF Transcript_30029/g.77470 Transcript_30029/m.77470 type:complete len:225 (+) Transcript_30029:493-1167(+)
MSSDKVPLPKQQRGRPKKRLREDETRDEEDEEAFLVVPSAVEHSGPPISQLSPTGKSKRASTVDPYTPEEAFRLLEALFDENPESIVRDGSVLIVQFCLAAIIEFLVRESFSVKKKILVDTYGSRQLLDAVISEIRKIGESPLAVALIFKTDYNWKRWIRSALRVIPEFFIIESKKVRDERCFDVEVRPMFELQSTPLSEHSKAFLEFIQRRVEECKAQRGKDK